jgi:cytochrome c peroxidase
MTRLDEMALTPEAIDEKLNKEPYLTLFPNTFSGQKPGFLLARRAISMYIRSLTSGNSKYDQYLLGKYSPTEQETRGLRLFFTHPDARSTLRGGNCGDCHQSITTSGNTFGFNGFKNNGLKINAANDFGLFSVTKAETDKGKFKIPSLRNIALTAPYMHDGRFKTLEEVLNHYNDTTLFATPGLDLLITAATNQLRGKSLGLTTTEKADIIAFLHMLTDSSATKR